MIGLYNFMLQQVTLKDLEMKFLKTIFKLWFEFQYTKLYHFAF